MEFSASRGTAQVKSIIGNLLRIPFNALSVRKFQFFYFPFLVSLLQCLIPDDECDQSDKKNILFALRNSNDDKSFSEGMYQFPPNENRIGSRYRDQVLKFFEGAAHSSWWPFLKTRKENLFQEIWNRLERMESVWTREDDKLTTSDVKMQDPFKDIFQGLEHNFPQKMYKIFYTFFKCICICICIMCICVCVCIICIFIICICICICMYMYFFNVYVYVFF